MSTGLGAGVADPDDDPLLERAQQLHLQRERHLADLVEEQRAAVGRLELALLVGDRAGEGALHVAEQLALEQVLGDGAAVDGDERLAWRAASGCGSRARSAPCRCRSRR